jgi:ABC-2 type transport system ATP-binding protein
MLQIDNVTKRYGRHIAVDRLSLTVRRGEIFGFIGPNGAGKTTTIKMIGGVLAPDAGAIRIAGIDLRADPVAAKRCVGFVPDRPYLYEKLTGMEFMRFSADLYGVAPEDFDRRARAELERFALMDWADELIESYSHGMKQRLILCAALLHRPQLIVVDEPMVGLDPAAIRLVKGLFRHLAAEGTTVFLSTHTLSVAEDLCDRMGILHRGRLAATGSLADLRREAGVASGDLEDIFLNMTRSPPPTGARSFPPANGETRA